MIDRAFDITTFQKMQGEMIAKNEQSWNSTYSNSTSRTRDYSLEEIKQIINSSSLA